MNTQSLENQFTYSTRHWWLSLILGILFIATGVWVLGTPFESYVSLTILFSITFILNGLIEIYTAISERKETHGWGWILVGGILDLLIGSMLVLNPALSFTILPYFVGFGLMFRSGMAIGTSINLKGLGEKQWGWMLVFGIAGVLFSLFLLRNPVFAGMTVVIWTGLACLSIGGFRIWLSYRLHQLKKAGVEMYAKDTSLIYQQAV